jgi:hypothetical protein
LLSKIANIFPDESIDILVVHLGSEFFGLMVFFMKLPMIVSHTDAFQGIEEFMKGKGNTIDAIHIVSEMFD